ncbi:MAG: energy-coupling factor transporter transmembrane protein EcfT [Synergistaceae bacterium]|jgi:energy-coupling factor transport system permease protein|nr:energy-coupling factor transporter transmembrane protein EcfT [Synergistaceae bacterium]
MSGFLSYMNGDSILHRLNPLTKLLMSAALCASCFLTHRHSVVIGVIVFNLCMSYSAGGLKRSLAMSVSFIKLALLLFVLQVFFVREGNIILTLPLNIYITDKGALFSSLFSLRLVAATMPLAIMLSVTRMSDISNVLAQKLRIPYKYTFALTTAIRFIPIFSEEMAGIAEAQTARGVEFDTKNFFKKIRLLLPLCVPLLISSVRKIEGSAISAELRGFNLRTRECGYKTYRFGLRDAGALVLTAAIIAAAVLI